MQWTEKQKQVIETRGCNLLVSAAAGSGKTAVLVERIIRLISEGPRPLDIDQLLVMTFTNAAAAEMRERIAQAVERKLTEQPDNEHLQAQAALVPYAQIMTIDSFCLSLIRDHFNLLDIDPAFRIGDEGELKLLRADVMQNMLEEYYSAGDPVFERFVDTYASGKSDSGIEDYIMQVYTFAQSNPFPEQWIGRCRAEMEQTGTGSLEGAAWMRFLMEDVRRQLGEMAEQYEVAMELCREPDGPEAYLPTLTEELRMLRGLSETETYDILRERLRGAEFGRLKAIRSGDIDPVKKELVSECRNRIKKAVNGLKASCGAQTEAEAAADLLATKDVVLKLLELAEEFARRYQEAKKDKNLVDFNDLEHYALEILVERPGELGSGAAETAAGAADCISAAQRSEESTQERNSSQAEAETADSAAEEAADRAGTTGDVVFTLHYTETADRLSRQYEEILVDEYQDSNYVQEALIQALSGGRFGRPNVFMVGDVKQSIYKFRLARPELFMEKYETYSEEKGPDRKIELHQNFRSRESVLDSVNRIFYQIMTKNLGNVDYTEEAALHPGAVFAEGERCGTPTELLLLDTGKESMGALEDAVIQGEGAVSRLSQEEAADYTARELETKMIARRMRELTDPQTGLQVWDKEKGFYRPAGYGDMVILLRSMAGWSETILQVLTREGIPAYAETGTGYFDTIEVETVLAMLAVIDNPIQDIPLAAALRSPMAGLSDEEMAWMMAAYKKVAEHRQDRGIYGAFRYLTEAAESRGREDEPESGVAAKLPGEFAGHLGTVVSKLSVFAGLLDRLRLQATYLPIHELVCQVYEQTGYYDYVSAMPAGQTRRANLDMLVEKASAFEKTSYKGLFQFIRYITQLKKYETDFGEASAGQYENMVRVMSIHKSKGLEFPIVFLAGTGKQFNKQDVRGRLIIDSDLGIATDYLDLELRVKGPTLKKNVLKRKMDLDNLGEELRVLYVAMTRAKEKLILTGADRSLAKKLEKWENMEWGKESRRHVPAVPYTVLSAAGSYLDWILMTHPARSGCMDVRQIPVKMLVGEEITRQIEKRAGKEELLRLAEEADEWERTSEEAESDKRVQPAGEAGADKRMRPAGETDTRKEPSQRTEGADAELAEADDSEEKAYTDASVYAQLAQCFGYRYPYEADTNLHTKMTVSELKKPGQDIDDFDGLMQAAQADYLSDPDMRESVRMEDNLRHGSVEEEASGSFIQKRNAHLAADDAGKQRKEEIDTPSGPGASIRTAMEQAARRGTAYHRVLELLDFSRTETCTDVENQIKEMAELHRIGKEAAGLIRPYPIWRFASSPIGERMRRAQETERLHREQQFILGIPAREMGLAGSDELVLIQGIIDAYMEEDDGLVLLDYKTDRIAEGQKEILAKRYKVQLDYYQRALEQMTKKNVKERYIYSLRLMKVIPV